MNINRAKQISSILLGIIFLLLLVYINQVNKSAVVSEKADMIQKQIDQLKDENAVLEEQVLSQASFAVIHDKAVEQGFSELHILYL